MFKTRIADRLRMKVRNSFSKSFQIKLFVTCVNLIIFGIMFTVPVFAGDLWGNAQRLVNDVYSKFVGMSTAAAGIGFATGAFMKKFSRGKQQMVEMGGKVQTDSVIAWASLNAFGLITAFLSGYFN